MTAPQLAPGQSVAGRLSIRRLLGYGGATATYAAATAQGREVALRLLSPRLVGRGDVLGVLQQTAVFTNSMPDVTGPVLESGFDPQTGAPFTVRDLITTRSLAQATQSGPLPVAEVASILGGLARAVDAAHARRIAHGGLKPQNVFLGQVRVVDFGMAAVRAAMPTPEGSAIASPWMAPEQLQGAPASPASDVFSAGLVAFFAATGKLYWRSCQRPQLDLAALQQEMVAPRIPASVRARDLGANLSAGFDAILARALAQSPAERFPSVRELADAVLKTGGPNKMAMTMPLNELPLAAQEMLRVARAAAAAAAPAPRGNDPRAMQSPPMPMPGQPGTGMPSPQPLGLQGMPPQGRAPHEMGLPQAGRGAPMLVPTGGYPPPMNAGPGPGFQQGVQAQPSYGPPPESAVVVPKSQAGLIIGIMVAVLVLAGGAAVAALLVTRPQEPTQAEVNPATQGAAQAPPPASFWPPASSPPLGVLGAVASSAPSGAAADALPEQEQGTVTIVCMPECDTIKIDDKLLLNDSDASTFPESEQLDLSPGAHTITVARATYQPQTRQVTVKSAQKEKVAFFLARPGAAAAPAKTCGKFLERCP